MNAREVAEHLVVHLAFMLAVSVAVLLAFAFACVAIPYLAVQRFLEGDRNP